MKWKVLLIFLVVSAQVHDSEPFLGIISSLFSIGSSIFSMASTAVTHKKKQEAIGSLNNMLNNFEGAANGIIGKLNNLYDKQSQQSNENFINIMLELNGINGHFDGLTSQVTDIDGKLVDISKMLDGMDVKLNTITDLVTGIDDKMNNFSSQVKIIC